MKKIMVIALALIMMLSCIACANNAAGNAPMLAVNARLGFVREPARIELELTKESLWT